MLGHEEHEIDGQTWIVFLLLVALFKVSENNCLAVSEKSEVLSSVIDNCVVLCAKIFNNYSPKAKLILLNNPRDEVEGIIQQY